MKSLDERLRNFDRDFTNTKRDLASARKWNIIFSVISSIIGLGLVGFAIWVIVTIMRFFGVI